MTYQPGLHIIGELLVPETELLTGYAHAKACVDRLIREHALTNLGEVYHNFSPGGFTAVICLSESHISMHSWPEHNRLHMDVYLSNFSKNNDAITTAVFQELVNCFNATILNRQQIRR